MYTQIGIYSSFTRTHSLLLNYSYILLAISTPYSSVYTPTHSHTHTHVHIHRTHTHTHMHPPPHTYTCMNMHTHMHSLYTHTHLFTQIFKHASTHTAHIHMHLYQYTVYHAQTSLPVSSHNLVAVEQFAARLSADRRNVSVNTTDEYHIARASTHVCSQLKHKTSKSRVGVCMVEMLEWFKMGACLEQYGTYIPDC